MVLSLYEAVLYTDDVPTSAGFYERVIGLRAVGENSSLMAVLRPGDPADTLAAPVLLIFNRTEASQPGREVPSHGALGVGHVAFRISTGEYDNWKQRLAIHAVPIEQEVRWSTGARSIYFRDPAQNSVELVEGDIWPREGQKQQRPGSKPRAAL